MSFTIAPKTVGLKWSGTSFTYNGKAQAPKATATGLVSGDKCSVTVSGAQKNAGSYKATAKLSNSNYKLPAQATQSFTIAKREVGLKWGKTTFPYDGKRHAPAATATGLVSGDKCTVTVTGAQTSAGSYKATATKLSNANYKLPSVKTKTFTITKTTQTAPAAPVVTAVTATSVTVQAVQGQQYTIDGGKTWKTPGSGAATYTFKGLTPGRVYSVKARRGATGDSAASPASAGARAKTLGVVFQMNSGLKVSQSSKAITVQWGSAPTATGFDIYVQYCGQAYSSRPTAKAKAGATCVTVTKVNGKAVDPKQNYKVYLVAKNGSETLGQTKELHGVASGKTAYSDPKAVSLPKTALSVSAGKTAKLGASVTLINPKAKALSDSHAETLRYFSSDTAIATVDENGVITAKAKGVCTIQVMARTGLTRSVTLTVN